MKSERSKTLEDAAVWLKKAGFDSDLSLFVAGILDIGNGADDVVTRILPALLQTTPNQADQVLEVIGDLQRQLEHIARHAEELKSFGDKALRFFDVDEPKS
jgi:hypothetical protein